MNTKEFADMVMETELWKEPETLYKALVNHNHLQKYEEIKRMALKIFVAWNTFHDPRVNPATAWENAEDFYNFAKEKEKAHV